MHVAISAGLLANMPPSACPLYVGKKVGAAADWMHASDRFETIEVQHGIRIMPLPELGWKGVMRDEIILAPRIGQVKRNCDKVLPEIAVSGIAKERVGSSNQIFVAVLGFVDIFHFITIVCR
jgi:hypothetical protein